MEGDSGTDQPQVTDVVGSLARRERKHTRVAVKKNTGRACPFANFAQRRVRAHSSRSGARERPLAPRPERRHSCARAPALDTGSSLFLNLGGVIARDGGQRPMTMRALSLAVLVASFCAATCPTYSQVSLWVVNCHERWGKKLCARAALTHKSPGSTACLEGASTGATSCSSSFVASACALARPPRQG